MPTSQPTSTLSAVTAKRVARSVWILRAQSDAGQGVASSLRSAFADVVERGAHDVVVELGTTAELGADIVDVLVEMAETLRRDGSVLWLAAAWPDGNGHNLRPVLDVLPAALNGVCEPLDRAIAAREATGSRRGGAW